MTVNDETIVRIETSPAISSKTILGALAAEGVDGSVLGFVPQLQVSVLAPDLVLLAERISAALERVVRDQARPLVPQRIGPSSYVVRPAAG
jgi:hypothetical protein